MKESKLDDKMYQIDGFFGIIGPDVPIPCKMTNLFDLFNKNGVLQGVFLSNGTIHFIRKYIKTDKKSFEDKYGEIWMNPFSLFIFELGNSLNILPNIFGLANTAFLNFQNKVFVLNERDLPYEIQVNFLKKEVQTKQKLILSPKIHHFLAHSKINKKGNLIETLDYSIFSPNINWFQLDENWVMKKQLTIHKKYNSMVHDFISFEKHILFLDSPLKMEYDLKNQISFHLSKNKNLESSLFIIEKTTGLKKKIDLGENCFLFHFGSFIEKENEIEFYGCFYDSFDFKTPKTNSGKFRKVIVNKKTNNIQIFKNNDLENYSLDFPIIYKDYTILTHSSDCKNTHFVIVKNFELHKVIDLDNKYINGEASLIEIEDQAYLICFTYKENALNLEHYLTLISIETKEHTSILLPFSLTLGFHSIFLKDSN
jgi:carotenoid cleavage dioxygenase-like enzyme